MSYIITTGLLAANCLVAMQRVLQGGSRKNQATLKACPINWLPRWRFKETRYATFTYRIA
jgi:hypothetical protein